jgi:hypothetical protein
MHLTLQPRIGGGRMARSLLRQDFRTYSAGTLPPGWTRARGTAALIPNAAGVYSARTTEEALTSDKGWLMAGAWSEQIADTSFSGAVVGVVGSGGALPTGWANSGLSYVAVESISSSNGLPYIALEIDDTAANYPYLYFANPFRGAGDYKGFLKYKVELLDGHAMAANKLLYTHYDGSGVSAQMVQTGTITEFNGQSLGHSAGGGLFRVLFNGKSGVRAHIRLTIYDHTVNKLGLIPDMRVSSSSSAVTASNGEVISAAVNLVPPFSMLIQARTAPAHPGAYQALFTLRDAGGDYIQVSRHNSTTATSLTAVENSLSPTPSSTTIADNTRFAVAFAVGTTGIRTSWNGGAVDNDADWVPSAAYTNLQLGHEGAGANPWWGWIESIRIDKGAWSDATLQARSAVA